MDEQPTPFPQPLIDDVAPARPVRRTRRAVAIVAATAVVAGLGGVGAGYAVGHGSRPATSTTASNGTEPGTTGTAPGVESVPGSGCVMVGVAQVGVPLTVDPYDGPAGGSTDPRSSSSDSTTKATGPSRSPAWCGSCPR